MCRRILDSLFIVCYITVVFPVSVLSPFSQPVFHSEKHRFRSVSCGSHPIMSGPISSVASSSLMLSSIY